MVSLAVVCISLYVSDDRGYPYRVEAEVLNVVELRDDALPRSPAVLTVGDIAGRARAIGCGEAIGDQLESTLSTTK